MYLSNGRFQALKNQVLVKSVQKKIFSHINADLSRQQLEIILKELDVSTPELSSKPVFSGLHKTYE